jgi:hypothetical protein
MSNPADSIALSPLMFAEAFFAGAAALQRQIADNMMTVFDAVADAVSDSLRAGAQLAQEIGDAKSPVDAAALGFAWFQGRAETSVSWFRALAERLWHAPAPETVSAVPLLPAAPAVKRAPVMPQETIAPKPPAGKVRRAAPIVVDKLPKKPARPGAK